MELTIEKLIYGGDGLARLPADEKGRGKAVLLPFVLAGERVEADIIEQRPGFARARLEKVLQASPHRVEPSCPYFGQCGGCHYQHADYDHQVRAKVAVLAETLRRTAKLELTTGIEIHPSAPWLYRNRTRMRVARPRGSGEFKLGYNRFGSRELLAVEQCPISSPLINRAIEIVWVLGRAGKVPPELFEIEFFANGEDEQMLVEVIVMDYGWQKRKKSTLLEFVAELRSQLPQVVGVAIFRDTGRGAPEREDIPPELARTFGTDHLVYATDLADYRVSAGSFFQTNRFLANALVNLVTAGRKGTTALDLYAGTGLFAAPLAKQFGQVVAVEPATSCFHDLLHNCPSNVATSDVTAEKFLESTPEERQLDLVIVDPPRAGLSGKVVSALVRLKPARITYVSCDPSTLARDLRVLTQFGYGIEAAHLVDLFPQTFHIESVLQLVR